MGGIGTWPGGTGCRIRGRQSGAAKRAPRSLPGRLKIFSDDRGLSHTHAALLMVAITVILAILLLLMLLAMIPSWSWSEPELPPVVITEIVHTSGVTGKLTYAGRVYLLNNGSTIYENDCLKAVFYRDGWKFCTVKTLNGHLLIPSHHYGVRYIKGEGCRSPYWNPGEVMEIDLADRNIVPGVMITVEIIDKQTNKMISKHTVKA